MKKNAVFIMILFFIVTIIIFVIVNYNPNEIRDKIIVKIDPTRPVVALTFDDGPNDYYTLKILDVLYENQCEATFFINGMNIRGNEDVLSKIVHEGHELSNHTYHHLDLTTLKENEIVEEIVLTQKTVTEVLGEYKLSYVRPPYGSYDEAVIQAIPYPIALWSLDSMDWELTDSDEISELVVNNIKDRDVIIMHDKSDYTVEAVKKIIPKLKENGYQFVTLTDLYHYRNDYLEEHQIYR
jgi:peptidoglycan/xylan/chitin deacetylase (PgdA/CDA1 family)